MHVKLVALFSEDSSLELVFIKKMIRYDSAGRCLCLYLFWKFLPPYYTLTIMKGTSMQAEEVYVYDCMSMHREEV